MRQCRGALSREATGAARITPSQGPAWARFSQVTQVPEHPELRYCILRVNLEARVLVAAVMSLSPGLVPLHVQGPGWSRDTSGL